jgi:hypothetical protein
MPYTEVYIRLPVCTSSVCNGHGTCGYSGGLPTCTSCDPGWSGASCDTYSAPYRSCDEIHDAFPAYGDGSYVVDPDGESNPLPAISVSCDMTTAGGGWTVIDYETFASGTATNWSDSRVDTAYCGASRSGILGGYPNFGAGVSTARTYDLLSVPHTEAYVSLDYFVFDSWDGERAQVRVDGSLVYDVQHFTGGSSNWCGAGWTDHDPHAVLSQPAHSSNSLTLNLSSTLDQGPDDEGWGADNVRVMIR